MTRGPWNEEADLVVVGASLAGLAAAILVADRRGRAVVVERRKELGGGAAVESATVAAAGSRFQGAAGIDDSPARLAKDVMTAARGQLEAEVVSAVAAEGAPLVAWLADRCGSPITLIAARVASGHGVPRLHTPGDRGGAGLLADLSRAASRHSHVSLRTGTVAEHLVRDESGGVRGVSVRSERRGAGQAIGGRVLLACGGFAGDDALVAEHCPSVAALPYQGAARATGDGLRLGLEVGAAVRRLGVCTVTPFLAMPGTLPIEVPLVDLGAVLVNQAGRRFADETADGLALAGTIRSQPGRVAYLLFDERIAATARAADPFFARVVLPRSGRRGASATDLARQLELDAAGLGATLDALATGRAGGADAFGRRPAPLEPPLHAIRVTGARRRTEGGLAVDAAARVLDAEGQPIAGLYAAGGAAAGLAAEGTAGGLPGTDALAALGLARLAALDVIAALSAAAEG